jgi:hypothetical protein
VQEKSATDSRGSARISVREIRGSVAWILEGRVDFQVNGETYFVSLAEDERRWLVFVESATGTRRVPVYVDEAEFEDLTVVVEDKDRRKLVN